MKLSLFGFASSLFVLGFSVVCTDAQSQDGGFLCEGGWLLHRDKCYLFSTYTRNWYAARQECQDLGLGADLAEVRIPEVNTFLFENLNASVYERYHMGLNDRAFEGFYVFNDDTFQAEYYNWFPGEPTNGGAENAHCMVIRFAAKRWHDERCDLVLPPICTKSPVQNACDPGWLNYKNLTCVYYTPANLGGSWEASRLYCESIGANIVAIRDALFQVFISETMPDPVGNNSYWIGLNDRVRNNYYVWSEERDKTDYLNWDTATLQPDNAGTAGSNCVALYKNVSNPNSFGWLDVGCDDGYRFICQYEAVDINECEENPCLNGGTWNNTKGFFFCDCPTGYTGQLCQTETPYDCEEDDWLLKDSSCYLFEGASENWFGGRTACQEYGGDLATILDEETNNFIKARVRIINADHFFGLNDLITEGYYVWLDESTEISYQDWLEGEPNNLAERGAQNCVSFNRTGHWLDRRCDRDIEDGEIGVSATGAFICRKPAVDGGCEDGWELFSLDNACFYFAPGSLNWHAARKQCQLLGADLADIRDEFANQFLADNMPVSPMYSWQFWIGLNDLVRAGSYVWLDEINVAQYTNWRGGQPDNLLYESENCAGYMRVNDEWGWGDRRCDQILSFICERPAVTYCGLISNTAQQNLHNKKKKPVVEGGSSTVDGAWPWQLAVQTENFGVFTYACGAVLISPEWALTSADCMNSTGPFRLVAGENSLLEPTGHETYRAFSLNDVTKHPNRTSDIALIHIEALDLSSDYINTACKPPADSDFAGNENCWITGWETSEGHNVLQETPVNVLTPEECVEHWGQAALDSRVVCSFDKADGSSSMCLPGDSGSPLVCEVDGSYQLVGIASFGRNCDEGGATGFMKVSHFLDWINLITSSQTNF